MKKIACVGYHATGAGVIDDLFREFDNVTQGSYEVECRLLQDPDGISDLEYNIVQNPHRLNSGFAIKRFEKYVKRTNRTYKKIFGRRWKELSFEYAKQIAKIDYQGYWHGDIWLLNPVLQYYHLFRRALSKIAPKKLKKPAYYNYFPWLHTYHACMGEDEFLEATRDYIDRLCDAMNPEGKEYVMLDQLYAPGNLARYMRYVRDSKVVVVDRDPRDVYIFQKLIKEHTLPPTAEDFCVVYRDSRVKISEVSPDDCLYITFEELIFDYEDSIKRVMEFVGVSPEHHVAPKTRFDPAISIKNTRLWEKHPEYADDVRIIEERLSDYLSPLIK